MGKRAQKTEDLRNSGEEGTTRNLVNTLEVWPGHSNSSGNSNVCRGFRGQAGEGSPTQSNLPQLLATRSGDQLHCLRVNRLGAGVDAPTPREAKSLWSESCPIFPQHLSACSSIGNLLASKTNNLDRTWCKVWFQGRFYFCQRTCETYGPNSESMAGITNQPWHREVK